MALFQKKIGTIFLKEDSETRQFITRMQELVSRVNDVKLKANIEKQIKLASYGYAGEQNIIIELKNSGMDMYVLHDIYLEYEDMSAQIDYIVITRKHVYVLECKNLIGNIEIDNSGNFIRSYELFGKKVKEGIYSPITQNERHLRVIKELRKSSKSNVVVKQLFEKFFTETYKPLIILANPKTYLNAKFAKKEIKAQVIRADQLISYIKEYDNNSSMAEFKNSDMQEMAEFFLKNDAPRKSDYTQKYEELVKKLETEMNPVKQETVKVQEVISSKKEMIENISDEKRQEEKAEVKKICPRCGGELVLRTSSKGEHVGKQFWGCGKFPKCRYIENI